MNCTISLDLVSKRFLTTQEASEYTGYSKNYLYQLIFRRLIPYNKPNNGKVVFDRIELDKWLMANLKTSKP